MSRYMLITKKVRIVVYMLLGCLAMLSACDSEVPQSPSKGFYVTGVSFHKPDWVPAKEYADDKAMITVSFNRAVDKTSVSSAFFILSNEQTAEEEIMDYTLHFSKDSKTVVIISKKSLAKTTINPDPGSGLLYIILMADGKVKDTSGELLDGDLDGSPGGKYSKILKSAI